MPDLHQGNKIYLINAIQNVFSGLVDILYPRRCFACDNSLHQEVNTYICINCLEQINKARVRRCAKCGFELGQGITTSNNGCPECENTYLKFDNCFFVSNNKNPIKNLIHQLKYKKHICLATPLSSLLINLLSQEIICEIDLIVPVPLHLKKKQKRGFNQSELMAKQISRKLSLPISINNLHRVKNTLSQTQLSRQQRYNNVYGAFKVKKPKDFFKKNVLLVDDVFTTGATASECTKSLKNARVNKVFLLALARSRL